MCAENYQNRDRFDKDIAKIKQGSFLPHMVDPVRPAVLSLNVCFSISKTQNKIMYTQLNNDSHMHLLAECLNSGHSCSDYYVGTVAIND